MENTKVDLVNSAYKMGRISGLTTSATREELKDGLDTLENLMAEWFSAGICVGYNFEDSPDPNSLHNIPRAYWNSCASNLMLRLLNNFGKEAKVQLVNAAATSYSRMLTSIATVPVLQYSSRMPLGSGNVRYPSFNKYYSNVEKAPISCETVKMAVGDVDNFYFDFSAYLNSGESILTYVITSDDALTISNLTALAIGTTKTAVSNDAFTYTISGTTYSKAAVQAGTAPGNDVIPQSTYGAVALDIDSAGAITVAEADDNATGYASDILAIAGIPSVAGTKFRMGTVTVISTNVAGFTFGTTDLDHVDSTVVYTDTNISGSRVIYTIKATGISATECSAAYQVKIIMTTSAGRIETRVRNFELTDIEID